MVHTVAPSLRGALLSAEARLRAKADATKQSGSRLAARLDCFAGARNDGDMQFAKLTVGLKPKPQSAACLASARRRNRGCYCSLPVEFRSRSRTSPRSSGPRTSFQELGRRLSLVDDMHGEHFQALVADHFEPGMRHVAHVDRRGLRLPILDRAFAEGPSDRPS